MPTRTRKPQWRLVVICIALVGGFIFFPSWSTLTIHAKNAKSISVSGALFQIRTFDGSLLAFPVRHGPHTFCVRYPDSGAVWAIFFNSDVGARPRIDIFVNHDDKDNVIAFRQTINQKTTLFTGSIKESQTSLEKPYSLDYL